jgi:antirestriction protein ArdC
MPTNEIAFSALLADAINKPGRISAAYTAFHGYSIGNRLLALAQCDARALTPGPISTFMGWKDKGRSVRKGERAICLCMPVTCKRRAAEAEAGDDDATFTRFVYRNNWFVLSQTDGADLALPALPEWTAERALDALQITRVEFTALDGNCQGFARARQVAISPVAALPHKTLFHEIGHVVLAHTAEAELTDDDRTPRDIREIEAEAVALVCCEALGLPGAEFSRGYIQHWNASGEPIPERSAQRILKAADQILRAGRPADTTDA